MRSGVTKSPALAATTFRAIKIVYAASLLRATPPAPPAHFTGREADLEKFTQLLTSGASVAITALHGMGGIGKTSLAQKLAERDAR